MEVEDITATRAVIAVVASVSGMPRPPGPARATPLWLAHHLPDDYDRCVRVGRAQVCRRCVVLYPLALVVLVMTWGRWFPPALDVALVAGLPLPAVVELAAEHLGLARHSPGRQVAVTVPLAAGLGRGLARYLEAPADPLFWSVVVVYTTVGVAGAWLRHRRRPGGPV